MSGEGGLRLVGTSGGGWDAELEHVPHDFYHGRGYHLLAESNDEGEAVLAVFERPGVRLAWPYLRRPIPGTDLFDAGCVYGYPGPVATGLDSIDPAHAAAVRAEAWSLITDAWRQQGIVSVFTTFNPLLGNAGLADGLLGDPSGPTPTVTVGRTVSIDLTRPREARLAAYEKETRYEIGRAYRAGLRTSVDADRAHLDDLVRLYAGTMQRNGAGERYQFTHDYFVRLLDVLGERGRLLVATLGDEVVGVLLFVVYGDLAHAHLTGVSDQHLRLAPLNAMLDATADAARESGARLLHLGGGRGGHEDSLYRFKRRIGDVETDLVVGRWVLDGAGYRALSAHRPTSGDTGAIHAAEAAFFPAYRAPSAG